MCLEPHIQFLSVKSPLARPLDSLIEIAKPRHRKQLLRHVMLNPRGRAQRIQGSPAR